MDKKQVLEALKKARENSKKRKFSQSFDLIINLKELDLKKPEQKVDLFLTLPNKRDKKIKVCGLLGPELYNEGKEHCDKIILKEDFASFGADKKELKKLAQEYDYFIGQANIMSDIAKNFGRILGVKGRMPNPKAGCVVPPKTALKPLVEKLQNTIRVITKNELAVKCNIGSEAMKDEELADNVIFIYSNLVNVLVQHEQNIKNVLIKLTMGNPVVVGGKND